MQLTDLRCIADNIVPISQSFDAFNALATGKDRLSAEDIQFFVEKKAVPEGLEAREKDPLYGGFTVLFRRQSNNARITIYRGGHTIRSSAGLTWLKSQKKTPKKAE